MLKWLLEGDPAIRWQVQRDLLGASARVYEKERRRIAANGWGSQLLCRQDEDGSWGGIYSPKWTSTTYTLLQLRDFGLPNDNAQAQRGCETFFFRGLERDGGLNWFKSFHHSETCVNGMALSLLAYFRSTDARVHSIAEYLLREQMADGGWNCQRQSGATHGSFHTTISVLEGLREYAQVADPAPAELTRAVGRGQEFLLCHRLYKSDHTGRVVAGDMTRLHFPPRWHYDILRALDYFRSVDAKRDERMQDGVNLVRSRQTTDGRWLLSQNYPGRVYFEMEHAGHPSRWNTLRALRVLNWWDQGQIG
ncbi:MAG: prenyltransferase/squalene oxidase repeat-containing protein [Anaerolineae bacterium]